jgi:hypothetical protein
MLGVATLLCVMTLSLLVSRVATVALRTTGLSQDAARFQARSALTGVGFTTLESEDILNHPARRRIVLTLMALSGAGVITTLASLLLSFAGTSGVRQPAARLGTLVLGLFILWRLALSDRVDRVLSRLIERGLARWTGLDARDYVRLLDIRGDYSIDELPIDDDDWLAGRRIDDLQLSREGVVVLGIRSSDGRYKGAPKGATPMWPGDTVVVYGRSDALEELGKRRAGAAGDRAHEEATAEHQRVLQEEAEADAEHGEHEQTTKTRGG